MSKQTEQTGEQGPLRDGEFQQIVGIGPGIEKRLHAAGVTTFEQLAALAPERICELLKGMVGVKPELIERKDWLGQARLLANQVAQSEDAKTLTVEEEDVEMETAEDPDVDSTGAASADTHPTGAEVPSTPGASVEAVPVEPAERQHYSSFLVELLVDDEQHVRRTRIQNIQSGEQDSWAGWEAVRLGRWITGQAGVNLLVEKPVVTGDPMLELPPPITAEQASVQGSLEITRVQTVYPGETDDSRSFVWGEPVQMRVELDLSQVQAEPACPLDFRAVAVARRVGASDRFQQGQASGVVSPGGMSTILIPLENLPPGLFHLDTLVSVSQVDDTKSEPGMLQATGEQKIVHVLPRTLGVRNAS
jgi:hypothetical protein